MNRGIITKKQRRNLFLSFFVYIYTYFLQYTCADVSIIYRSISTYLCVLLYMHVYGCNDEALADSSSQVWHGGFLQIIQSSLDCDLVLKPMVTWGSHIKKKNMIYLEDP